MRWLFVTTPGLGHVQPLLALALAARARGHVVAWASGADGLAAPKAHGLEGLPCGASFAQAFARMCREHPQVVALSGREHAPYGFPMLFGRILGRAMLPALQAAAGRWRPDVVVSEPAALAAPLLAASLGLPHLTHEYGLAIPPPITLRAAEMMAPAWRAAGMQVPPDAGIYAQAVVEIAPPSLRGAFGVSGLAPRCLARSAAEVAGRDDAALPPGLQTFLQAHAGGPIVALSFGTLHRNGTAFEQAVAAAARARVPTVVLLGPQGRGPSTACPWIHVERYVHYPLLLHRCTAMVSHGGAGSMLAAMAQGLPQLLVPYGADQFRNADAAVRCGAALRVEGDTSPQRLREAIDRLLDDPVLLTRASELRAEIEAMPSAADCVAQLEQALVSGHFRNG